MPAASTDIFKVGGAQAIAAMAYGTASVPKVDKIFGPGNAWVTAAKQAVAMDPAGAALDMPAGPSEVMVIADAQANPRFVALDLLSQAEHGPDSQVMLVTHGAGTRRRAYARRSTAHCATLPRGDILRAGAAATASPSSCRTCADGDRRRQPLRARAPDPAGRRAARAGSIRSQAAGSVFLGAWTPESVGDYCSGTNHVLPTYGYARAYSGLSVGDFQRRMTRAGTDAGRVCARLAPTVAALTRLEGLEAHGAAVSVRPGRLPVHGHERPCPWFAQTSAR